MAGRYSTPPPKPNPFPTLPPNPAPLAKANIQQLLFHVSEEKVARFRKLAPPLCTRYRRRSYFPQLALYFILCTRPPHGAPHPHPNVKTLNLSEAHLSSFSVSCQCFGAHRAQSRRVCLNFLLSCFVLEAPAKVSALPSAGGDAFEADGLTWQGAKVLGWLAWGCGIFLSALES